MAKEKDTSTRISDIFEEVDFNDSRINKRLIESLNDLSKNTQANILSACGEVSKSKGFYRFLSNEKVEITKLSEAVINSTVQAIKSANDVVLLVQDTSDINLNGHKQTEGLGYCSEHIKGVKLHSCIALNPDGISLGLMGQFYETRILAKNPMTKAEKSKRSIEDKESYCWLKMMRENLSKIPKEIKAITVCDREADIYELYAEANNLDSDFVIRVAQNRKTDQEEKIMTKIRETSACGEFEIMVPRDSKKNIQAHIAVMQISSCRVNVLKPAKLKKNTLLPDNLSMNVVRIYEKTPIKEPGIEWILVTSLPIESEKDVKKIVEYYSHRWKIERFHYILKSGCNVEKIQQRTYDKIKIMLLLYSVIASFILAITYIGRVMPNTKCDIFFSDIEWKMLYRIANKTKTDPEKPYSMSKAIEYLGEIGSYKHSPSRGEYGVKAIWQGLTKLLIFLELYESQR